MDEASPNFSGSQIFLLSTFRFPDFQISRFPLFALPRPWRAQPVGWVRRLHFCCSQIVRPLFPVSCPLAQISGLNPQLSAFNFLLSGLAVSWSRSHVVENFPPENFPSPRHCPTPSAILAAERIDRRGPGPFRAPPMSTRIVNNILRLGASWCVSVHLGARQRRARSADPNNIMLSCASQNNCAGLRTQIKYASHRNS